MGIFSLFKKQNNEERINKYEVIRIQKDEEELRKLNMFVVLMPEGDGVCSYPACPCPETSIPRGSGYIYISPKAVNFRRDARTVEKKGACTMSIKLNNYYTTWEKVFTYFLGGDNPRVKKEEIIEKITMPLTTCRKCNYKFSNLDIMRLTDIKSVIGTSPFAKCPKCSSNKASFSLVF